MDKNITGNNVVSSDFLKVLLALKQSVMKDLNVSDIAIVTQIKDNYNIYCKSLNNSSSTIVCTKLNNLELTVNDCVLILYTNEDFRSNLKRYKSNKEIQNMTNSDYHNKSYGVIIGVL